MPPTRVLFGRNVVVLAHALTKESRVSDADIDRAIARMRATELDPDSHLDLDDADDETQT